MPGTLWTIWFVSPCPMKPAPIMPTRMGLPSSSRALRALSTMIIRSSAQRHPAFHFAFDLREVLPRRVLRRHHADRQRPAEPQARVDRREAALLAGRVELAHLVAGLGAVLERLVAVREPLRHVQRAVVVRRELDGDVLQVGRALRAQVDDDVEDLAAG